MLTRFTLLYCLKGLMNIAMLHCSSGVLALPADNCRSLARKSHPFLKLIFVASGTLQQLDARRGKIFCTTTREPAPHARWQCKHASSYDWPYWPPSLSSFSQRLNLICCISKWFMFLLFATRNWWGHILLESTADLVKGCSWTTSPVLQPLISQLWKFPPTAKQTIDVFLTWEAKFLRIDKITEIYV